MDGATEVNTERLSDSVEMQKFYRVLAVTQARIISYVSMDEDDESKKKRAVEMTEKLEKLEIPNVEFNKCGNLTWNPITRQCE